jgi:CubicO group peptidase (beta-lactamase class C family)
MNLRFALRSLVGAALLAGSIAAAQADGSFDIPAGAHFNPQKLARIGDFFRNEIATGQIPGAIVLIQQHGKPVYFEKFGVRDAATGLPMTDDTIFTVYSMSKPVTRRGNDADRRGQAEAERCAGKIHPGLRDRQGRRGAGDREW